MTVVALAKAPLCTIKRGPKGDVLGQAEGNINGMPLTVTLTVGEIHIAFADRTGPVFALDLNAIVKAAVAEIETLLGMKQKGAR